jgi:hypothetical protein
MTQKACCKCKQIKPLDEFHNHKASVDGKQKTCKTCQKVYSQSDVCKANRKAYYQKNKLAHIERNLKRQYGLDWENYSKLLESQNNCCAICKSPDSGSMCSQRLFVDHCHDTGKVRGLLCHHCNTALGLFQDNPLILKSAINYLNDRLC